MDHFNILILALGLSVDTSIASLAQGSFIRQKHILESLKISISFALFQGIMPIVGWIMGQHFYDFFKNIDHWLAFTLFLYLGVKLIYDSFYNVIQKKVLSFYKILVLSIATSVDSMVAGLTLSFINTSVLGPSVIIGVVTFFSSMIGFWIGMKFNQLHTKYVEIIGGCLLIFLGFKILIEHLLAG